MSLIHANSATTAIYCELFLFLFCCLFSEHSREITFLCQSVLFLRQSLSSYLCISLRLEAWSPAPAAGKSAVRLVIQILLTRVACPNWAKFNTAHPWVPGTTQVWRRSDEWFSRYLEDRQRYFALLLNASTLALQQLSFHLSFLQLFASIPVFFIIIILLSLFCLSSSCLFELKYQVIWEGNKSCGEAIGTFNPQSFNPQRSQLAHSRSFIMKARSCTKTTSTMADMLTETNKLKITVLADDVRVYNCHHSVYHKLLWHCWINPPGPI